MNEVPPLVVGVIPNKGDEDGSQIHKLHLEILDMAVQLKIQVISMSSDGAAAERSAQMLMDHERRGKQDPLTYSYLRYGVSLHAPVFDTTGPLVCVQDPNHAMKTCRNQIQHGTHTGALGQAALFNNQLVLLQATGVSGMVRADVVNVDKQDDGAARRLFHEVAITAMTTTDEGTGKMSIKDEFLGLFVYTWIFSEPIYYSYSFILNVSHNPGSNRPSVRSMG